MAAKTENEHFDVLILGGGISGLSAAHYLTTVASKENQKIGKKNPSVGLIEAQERFGGRLHTTDFGTGYVELGGYWIHGTSPSNSTFNLANTLNLIKTPFAFFDRSQGSFLHSSGVAIDQGLAKRLYDRLKVIEYKTVGMSPDSEHRTLEKYLNDEVAKLKKSGEFPVSEHGLIDAAFNYAKQYIQLHGGDSLWKQAAWGLGAYTEIDGDVTITGGYRALLERMIEEMEEVKNKGVKMSLRSSEEVIEIDTSSSSLISVKTSKGRNYTANYLLVTFSLGVLKKRHQNIFNPPLPLSKIEVINRLGFGQIAKVYLAYERPFWAPGTLNCLKLFTDPAHLNPKDDGEDDEDKYDLLGLVNGFEEIPSSSNVLLAWITGDQAPKVERWPTEEIGRACTRLLRRFTGDPTIPAPEKVLVSGWNGNPFVRGSYSYPSMETASREDFARLGEPVVDEGTGKPRIFFSGEATHPHYYSAAHGARSTGLNAAQAISKQFHSS